MFLTTKGRYAIMAMLDMYESCIDGKVVSIKSMAERQNLSIYYLEQLFCLLKKHNIVNSVKGPGGGYVFAKLPSQIYLYDILKAVGEKTKTTKCGEKKDDLCQGAGSVKCNSHMLWVDFGRYIDEYFLHTTLEDVKEGNFYKQKNFK